MLQLIKVHFWKNGCEVSKLEIEYLTQNIIIHNSTKPYSGIIAKNEIALI